MAWPASSVAATSPHRSACPVATRASSFAFEMKSEAEAVGGRVGGSSAASSPPASSVGTGRIPAALSASARLEGTAGICRRTGTVPAASPASSIAVTSPHRSACSVGTRASSFAIEIKLEGGRWRRAFRELGGKLVLPAVGIPHIGVRDGALKKRTFFRARSAPVTGIDGCTVYPNIAEYTQYHKLFAKIGNFGTA